LFLVRHGETRWNRDGRFQGQRDTELSELGLAQGDRVAAFLAGHDFDAVVSSPLKRARVTGEKIAASCGCRVFEIMDDLTEINHGDWEGLLSSEVRERWPRLIELWHESPHTVVMPGEGGESLRTVQIRAVKAVTDIAERHGGDVCVTAHDAVLKVLFCHFLGAPLSSFWSFQIANCSLTIAELPEGRPPRISLLGDSHYLADGGKNFDLPEQKGL
jgi:probable phosphoglycerate mutase